MSKQLEKLFAIVGIGICDAILDGSLSMDEAEQLLFCPAGMAILDPSNLALIEIIELGCQFDDFKTLLPKS